MRISIEGNIGAGKSTTLKHLQNSGYEVFPEPVQEWKDWLPEFYADKKRWAFGFQMKVLSSFLTPTYPDTCIVERSPVSTRHVFGQLLYNDGCLTDREWSLFKDVYDSYAWTPDVIIYIKVDPEVALKRIKARDRRGESHIDLEYIKKINFQYNIMLKYDDQNRETYIIDGNQSPDVVAREIEAIIRKTLDNINTRDD